MNISDAVSVPLPTPYGTFLLWAFEQPSGDVYVAMVHGDLGDGHDVLVRVHSECLTGDALESLRCDCGIQLRLSLRTIGAEKRGVVVYATGQEGRGIGLLNKLRAYAVQDAGADTVDANTTLGLPVDCRDYTGAAAVLEALGIRSIRLLTNNPLKVSGLSTAGIVVDSVVPLPTSPHHRNLRYRQTKTNRLGHLTQSDAAPGMAEPALPSVDVMTLLGEVRPCADRPYVVLKYAQSLDGRIATSTGDARWISGQAERRMSHALRAACDAVLVGVDTVIQDEPQLTVRMVPGASPTRIVVDSTLRVPLTARVLDAAAPTTIITTERSSATRRAELRGQGVRVEVVAEADGRVDLAAAFGRLRDNGIQSVLVEGGAQVLTSLLSLGIADRMIVAVAPLVIGAGVDAVGALGVTTVSEAIRLTNRSVHVLGDDIVLAGDVRHDASSCGRTGVASSASA